MLKQILAFVVSFGTMSAIALLASSADQDGLKYQPVANWLKLPAEAKLGPVTAVATDANDRLYVFHRGKQPIMVFDRDGKFVRAWGDGLIKTAHGLRVDGKGNVWVTDIGTHLVTKFDPEGKVLLTLGKKDQPGDSPDQFNKPTDVAAAPSGEFYVSDGYGNSRVVKFSAAGKYLKEWGKKGKGNGEFNLPHAVVLDGTGKVYVGDRENNRVQVFDAEGKYLGQWPDSGAPYGLYLTADHMLVADGRANAVRLLDRMGKPLGRWGDKGSGPGQFNMPHGICADTRGVIYVAEVDGQRVQKFVAK